MTWTLELGILCLLTCLLCWEFVQIFKVLKWVLALWLGDHGVLMVHHCLCCSLCLLICKVWGQNRIVNMVCILLIISWSVPPPPPKTMNTCLSSIYLLVTFDHLNEWLRIRYVLNTHSYNLLVGLNVNLAFELHIFNNEQKPNWKLYLACQISLLLFIFVFVFYFWSCMSEISGLWKPSRCSIWKKVPLLPYFFHW